MSSSNTARSLVAVLVLAASTLVAVMQQEGYEGQAMIPVPGDVYTYGYGTTKGVHKGDRIDPVRASIRLLDEIENVYAAGVRQCVTAPLYPHEFGTYVTLAYNIGVGAFCRKAKPGKPPNLIDLINSQQYAAACQRIEAFNKFHGKPLRGLTILRAKQRAACEGKNDN